MRLTIVAGIGQRDGDALAFGHDEMSHHLLPACNPMHLLEGLREAAHHHAPVAFDQCRMAERAGLAGVAQTLPNQLAGVAMQNTSGGMMDGMPDEVDHKPMLAHSQQPQRAGSRGIEGGRRAWGTFEAFSRRRRLPWREPQERPRRHRP